MGSMDFKREKNCLVVLWKRGLEMKMQSQWHIKISYAERECVLRDYQGK